MSAPIRIGIIGCSEQTHGKAWAELLAKPEGAKFGMIPARVWDADRAVAEALAQTVGAIAVDDSREAGEGVDGVLITEPLPHRYLELGRPFLQAGKRIFFNRPFAGSVADAKEILRLARERGAKIYSASALFHTKAGEEARRRLPEIAPVRLFNVTGCTDHIWFYLPHAIACLVSVLGAGITRVQAVSLQWRAEDPLHAVAPVVIYVEYGAESQAGAACGVIEMLGPESSWYGFRMKLFGAKAEAQEVQFEVSYDLLLETMAEFFRTGVEPVPHDAILAQCAVFHATLDSARQGGRPLIIADLLRHPQDAGR
jgi:predicted dehydrogenase